MTALHETSKARSILETNLVARHPLTSFVILAILITWLFALPMFLISVVLLLFTRGQLSYKKR